MKTSRGMKALAIIQVPHLHKTSLKTLVICRIQHDALFLQFRETKHNIHYLI